MAGRLVADAGAALFLGSTLVLTACTEDDPDDPFPPVNTDTCTLQASTPDELTGWGDPWEPRYDMAPPGKFDLGDFADMGDGETSTSTGTSTGTTLSGLGEGEPPEIDPILDDVGISPCAPGVWQLDERSGAFYRYATASEVLENEWEAGSVLVISPLFTDGVAQGVSRTVMTLPVPPAPDVHAEDGFPRAAQAEPGSCLRVFHMPIQLRSEFQPGVFVLSRLPSGTAQTPASVTTEPTFRYYVRRGLDIGRRAPVSEPMAWILGDESGDLRVMGAAPDRTFMMRGQFDMSRGSFFLETPLPVGTSVLVLETQFGAPPSFSVPSGTTASPRAHNQCHDEIDNDADGEPDTCDYQCVEHTEWNPNSHPVAISFEHSRNIGIAADWPWCAAVIHRDGLDWRMELEARAFFGAQILNWVEAPPDQDLGRRTHPVRFPFLGCTDYGDLAAARQCHAPTGSGCPPEYALSAIDDNFAEYLDRAWQYLDDLVGDSDVAVQPFSLTHIVAEQVGNDASGTNVFGLAATDPTVHRRGASVAAETGPICTTPHEIGHTLGMPHDDGTAYDGEEDGFMNRGRDPGDCAPVLGEYIFDEPWELLGQGLTLYEVWTSISADQFYPRGDGFLAGGCDSPDDCGYYPGLICSDDRICEEG